MQAHIPADEAERLAELYSYDILDTIAEQAYDDITFLASEICDSPIAMVSLIDQDRQWFKSKVGLNVSETPRDQAFCAHAILEPTTLMVVPDATADARFSNNPLVTDEPGIRFYAGAPLVTSSGRALGTLCVIDREPRQLTANQERALAALARLVMARFELRSMVTDLQESAEKQHAYEILLEKYQRNLEKNLATVAAESMTDSLTELNNRRAFLAQLDYEFERGRRYGSQLSVAMLDVDHFKSYNDEFGHPAGDDVLKTVARVLEEEARSTDVISRFGGEEFAVLLVETGSDTARVIAERFRKAVESYDWELRDVTISVGVAGWSPGLAGPGALISIADQALYRAKHAGRNVVISEEADRQSLTSPDRSASVALGRDPSQSDPAIEVVLHDRQPLGPPAAMTTERASEATHDS